MGNNMGKRITVILFVLIIFLCAGSIFPAYADGGMTGTCGENLNWVLDEEGILTISGAGALISDHDTIYPWTSIREDIRTVIIESGVTSIGESAFFECLSLTNIEIPGSVDEIGSRAFWGCNGLENVTISTGVNSIGNSAFSNCKKLTAITIPEGVTTIGDGAFGGCTGLISVIIPGTVENMGENVFAACSGLKTAGCLTSNNICFEWVNKIPDKAFYGDDSLKSVDVTGFNKIGDYAFTNCSSLASVRLSSVRQMGISVFEGCRSLNTAGPAGSDCNIEYGWTETLCANAFRGADFLTSITIPDNIYFLEDYSIYDCSALSSITLSGSVTQYGDHTFDGCDNVRDVYYFGDQARKEKYFRSVFNSATWHYPETEEGWTLCGDALLYQVDSDSGILYIKGTGAMWRWEANETPWNEQKSIITSISMEEGITKISACAFLGFSKLLYAPIPSTVTVIENNSFCNCSRLKELTIPESVTRIGYAAFYNCPEVETLTIPAAVEEIGDDAFYSCTGLTEVIINSTNVSFGSSVFSGCDGLTSAGPIGSGASYQFPWTERIPSNACSGLSHLTELVIPGTVTQIGDGAFENCSSLKKATTPLWEYFDNCQLTEVIIPEGVTSVLNAAFSGLNTIQTIDIPEGVTSIGDSAFSGCYALKRIELPETVVSIGNHAFYSCGTVTDLVVPGSVRAVGDSAFRKCASLESVVFLNGITEITGSQAFDGCRSLTTVQLPPSVTILGTLVFTNCSSLVNVISPVWHDFDNCPATHVTLPDGLVSIPESAFDYCYHLESVTIPAGVTSIGRKAFYYCNKLTSIAIPGSVTSIDYYAFDYCTNLTTVVSPVWANFNSCPVTEVTIPYGVTAIADNAFNSCALSRINIPSGVTSIGAWAFSNCYNLNELTIPDGVVSIGDGAFSGSGNLTKIRIPGSVTSVGSSIFMGCNGLTSAGPIESGSSIEFGWTDRIPGNTFAGFRDVFKRVTIPSGITIIGENAFSQCSGLTSLDIPESVLNIEEGAFDSCTGLTTVTVPGRITEIKENTFRGCSSLETVVIPSSVTSISSFAFGACYSLADVYYSGSRDMWNQISISNSGNDQLLYSATIHYGKDLSGTCGENLTWTLSESGELRISGTGNMTNYSSYTGEDTPWYAYRDTITSVVLSTGVTGIGKLAFAFCRNMEDVTIPETVTSIGSMAFEWCSGLRSISIPNGVKTIGSTAFMGCSQITKLIIPANVESIAYDAFNNCTGIKNAGPIGGDYDFEYGWTETIPTYPFRNFTSLESVVFPDSIKEISGYAFPNSNLRLAFYEGALEQWSTVTIGSGNGSLNNVKFRFYPNILSLPASLSMINEQAFMGVSMQQIVIPADVEYIGSKAFAECENLQIVEILNPSIEIESDAFADSPDIAIYAPPSGSVEEFAQTNSIPFIAMR